ncbi:hypothetical protein [Sphingobacterium yanglingense]|uniref:Uncharacterized protein n=1 Tax=Sphingobacterium yanglingense TaxID=1437280 RepID=A0A4R6WLC6_9SPHI|nr:hypothetical protein [Sphingobacterium yanglingense]TDQ79787.1 hypothetical protein CLV99_1237 [Sphingobacterium yanglingense]
MKPSKSRYYCPEAQRHKILFESEKKAEDFIRYNNEEIRKATGYAPVRSYQCIACDGWHVTSSSEVRDLPIKTEMVIQAFREAQEEEKKRKEQAAAVRQEWRDRLEAAAANLQMQIDVIKEQIDNKGDKNIVISLIEEAFQVFARLGKAAKFRKHKRDLERELYRLEFGAEQLPDDAESNILVQIQTIEYLLEIKSDKALIHHIINETAKALRTSRNTVFVKYSNVQLEGKLNRLKSLVQ